MEEEKAVYSPVREDAVEMAEATIAAYRTLEGANIFCESETLLHTAERLAMRAYSEVMGWTAPAEPLSEDGDVSSQT